MALFIFSLFNLSYSVILIVRSQYFKQSDSMKWGTCEISMCLTYKVFSIWCFSVITAWKMIILCMYQSHVRAVAHAGLMVWHWYALMHKCMNATRAWKWAWMSSSLWSISETIKLKYLNKEISLRYSNFISYIAICPLLKGSHLHLWYLSDTPEWLTENDQQMASMMFRKSSARYKKSLPVKQLV